MKVRVLAYNGLCFFWELDELVYDIDWFFEFVYDSQRLASCGVVVLAELKNYANVVSSNVFEQFCERFQLLLQGINYLLLAFHFIILLLINEVNRKKFFF